MYPADTLLDILLNFIHIPGIVLAYTLHEYTRAAASAALGDATPKNQGRLAFNPAKHFEPVGFMCLAFFGLGWGRPVETRSFGYKDRKKAEIIVYTLPSVMNLVVALIFGVCAWLLTVNMSIDAITQEFVPGLVYNLLLSVAHFNLCYALFNLIPMYPLDAARVIAAVKPQWGAWLKGRERLIQTFVMLLLCSNILYQAISKISNVVLGFMYV